MTDYESLISNYTSGYESLIYNALIGIGLTTFLFFGYYIYKSIKIKKQRKEEDLKLQGYFEKYSDIIADKVVAKLKEQK